MAEAERVVRHLRLAAGSADAVSAVLPRLEDALRCASLPDAGGRLLLVRRLALGPIARDASSQALSRLIEQRVADAGVQWVAGGTPAAAHAASVGFASPFDARVQLGLRLARQRPCAEWYWPLAVPEFDAALGAAENLRRIARTLACSPEARSALPAWLASLVQDGVTASVAAAIGEREGLALLQAAGIPATTRHGSGALDRSVANRAGAALTESSALAAEGNMPAHAVPHWLLDALAPCDFVLPRAPQQPRAAEPERSAAHPPRPPQSAVLRPRVPPPTTLQTTAPTYPAPGRDDTPSDHAARMADAPRAMPDATARRAIETPPWLDTTACAGLCFLLPVLARVGITDWCDDPAARFADRVLRAALRRLQADADDPAWHIAAAAACAPRIEMPAPDQWQHAWLAAPRRGALPLADALTAAADADAQALVWLDAVRRWLRRGARIGLASLVLRPGLFTLGPTHVDLHFRLRDTDLRVRRAGLDIDPGWLPWFGRVVTFHYRSEAR